VASDRHLVGNGITLPVHVGLCGPTRTGCWRRWWMRASGPTSHASFNLTPVTGCASGTKPFANREIC